MISRDMLLAGMTVLAVAERLGIPVDDVQRVDDLLWSTIDALARPAHRMRLAGASVEEIGVALAADPREVDLALASLEHHRWDVVLEVDGHRIDLPACGLVRLWSELVRLAAGDPSVLGVSKRWLSAFMADPIGAGIPEVR